ncbi:MAG: extracellular solute-binding protein [Spirochaetaceae bacterium]|jgi:putative aldouronate transport system substrate-binding protein|nr:extracellular solute-binding protein [Spirochaetaceae bacterium]
MKKKLVSAVLAGLGLGSLTVNCAKAPENNAQKTPVQEIAVEVFNRGTDGGRSDPTKNNYTDWIQKKLLEEERIKVAFISVPRSDEVPSLNNMMAAGNPPDICLTYDLGLISNFRDLGGLYDMAPNIGKLMPDLDKFLGEDPMLPGRRFILRAKDPQTSAVYSIPARRMNTARLNTFIRKDWLDKLGLPLPATTQEFYQAMAAFKKNDPGGVGRDRVIPMVSNKNARWNFGNLLESFIDPNITIKDEWVNTVADRSYLLPGYKEGVRFLNKMYNEGLIDPDFPLYTSDDEPFARLKSGVAGSYQHNYDMLYRDSPGVLRDLQANVPGGEFAVIDPFHHPSGKTIKYAYDAAGVFFFIPKSSKAPEAAMRYVNWLSRFENMNFIQLGPEGIGYDLINGIPKVKPAPGLWIQNSPQNIDYTLPINGLELGDPAKNMQALANSYNCDPKLIYDAYELSLKNARPLPVIPVVLSAAGPVQQTLIDLGDVLMAESIKCPPASFDQTWDQGIQNWLSAGAEIVRNERAAKYIDP